MIIFDVRSLSNYIVVGKDVRWLWNWMKNISDKNNKKSDPLSRPDFLHFLLFWSQVWQSCTARKKCLQINLSCQTVWYITRNCRFIALIPKNRLSHCHLTLRGERIAHWTLSLCRPTSSTCWLKSIVISILIVHFMMHFRRTCRQRQECITMLFTIFDDLI